MRRIPYREKWNDQIPFFPLNLTLTGTFPVKIKQVNKKIGSIRYIVHIIY